MLYEEMLVLGRRVQEGFVETEEGRGGGRVVEIENNSGNGISSKNEQVRDTRVRNGLWSGTFRLINTYHQAIMTDRKSRKIENSLEEIERRLELVEKAFESEKKVDQRPKKENSK